MQDRHVDQNFGALDGLDELATASRDNLGLKSVPRVSLDLEKDESVT
jgi:hypothetical protein